ncbi:MAG: right-handed parallel beta-helix repeat-containing protein [Chloroflexota bacterium]
MLRIALITPTPTNNAAKLRRILRFFVLLMFMSLSPFVVPVAHGATFTVTSPLDDGSAGTLRDAINTANGNGEADTIQFAPALDGATIALQSTLSLTEDGTTIDGLTGLSLATAPNINIDASGIPCGDSAIAITSNGNTIQGLAIYGVSGACAIPAPALAITGDTNTILTNFVGLDAVGNAIGNGDIGVSISGASSNRIENNTIGGNSVNGIRITLAANGNLVLGNFIGGDSAGNAFGNVVDGIDIRNNAFNNTIQGNIIRFNGNNGIDVRGSTMPAPPTTTMNTISGNTITDNGNDGIQIIFQASDNLIENNIIGGNTQDGMRIADLATGNEVRNNLIGVDASNTAIGNGNNGILIENEASNNTIDGNTIRFNVIDGIAIIGTTMTPLLANTTLNTISGNTISDNSSDGITIIDGATNNSVSSNNTISNNGDDGIEILGTTTTLNTISGNTITNNAQDGVIIGNGASANTVSGNTIGGNTLNGINITGSGADSNQVLNNFIGVDASSNAIGNGERGIQIGGAASSNIIEANTIGRNTFSGIIITNAGTDNNEIRDNFIGVDSNGNDIGNGINGVRINDGASANTVEGNTIGRNTFSGVTIINAGTENNEIRDNFIGVDSSGNNIGNSIHGVVINDGASANTVEGNTIGENTNNGIRIDDPNTDNNTISNNFIGVDASDNDIGNGNDGVQIDNGASDNLVQGNTISGNDNDGVDVRGGGTSGNQILNNTIGLNAAGSTAIANGNEGIRLSNNTSDNTITGNTISGNTLNGIQFDGASDITITANTISSNGSNGILLTNSSDDAEILSNSITNNGGLGIDLSVTLTGDGVTLNDGADADTGPNDLLNFPVISTVETVSGVTTVIFSVATSAPTVTVEFFENAACDSNGFGEGETPLEVFTNVPTNSTETRTLSATVTNGGCVTATTTEVRSPVGITSEFSAGVINTTSDPDLSVTKLASVTTADSGDTVAYTITVENIGVQDATNATLTDTVPSQLTFLSFINDAGGACSFTAPDQIDCNFGTLTPGSTRTVAYDVLVGSTAGNAVNLAQASADFDPDSSNNTASVSVALSGAPTLTPTNTVIPPPDNNNDDPPVPTAVPATAIIPMVSPPTAIAPTFVLPTAVVPTVIPPTVIPPTFVLPTAVVPTVVPPTVSLPTVAPPTVIIPTMVPPTIVPPSVIPPTALPPTLAIGTDIAITQIVEIVGTDTVRMDTTMVNMSDEIIFDLRLIEAFLGDEFELVIGSGDAADGNGDGTDIVCRKLSSTITCDLGDLPPGLSENLTFLTQGQLDTLLTSQTRILAANIDAIVPSEPYVVKIVSPAFAQPGTDIVYTIRAINPSSETATSIVLTDEIPPQLAVVDVEANVGTARVTDGLLTYRRASMEPGEVFSITLTTRASGETEGMPAVTNNACLDYSEITTPVCDEVPVFFVSELPSTGETPWWVHWVAVGMFALAGVAIASIGLWLRYKHHVKRHI